ncbi:MAG TPA: GNAT family N-acetyltransferase, partial [Sinorhizobium sp.]|nr:GNAT family N-acetyltransferase [Sinorhizobium sp.]
RRAEGGGVSFTNLSSAALRPDDGGKGRTLAFTIAVESPLTDEVRALVQALNAYADERTPPAHRYQLTVEQMAQPDTTMFVARDADGRAIGMGGLRRHGAGIGEVKRMYVRRDAQGHGVGSAILAQVERLAREEGFVRLVLETGSNFDEARRVYERAGFASCDSVLDYPPSPWTAFYQKALET